MLVQTTTTSVFLYPATIRLFKTRLAVPQAMFQIAVLVLILFFWVPLSASSNQTYSVAVVPQLPKPITHKNWGPLLHQLSKITGYNFKLKIYGSFQDFEQAILQGTPDFAYMNPYHQIMAHQSQGYVPIIRDNSEKLNGIIVVRKDSPIRSAEDLRGKTIAFPSPIAFAASLYMRSMLAREHIEFEAQYVMTHTNVYRNVILEVVDAGGGVNKTLDAERAEVQNQLRIIYTIPGVASHPLSAHPRVPEKVQSAVIQAILLLVNSTTGKQILNAVQINQPILADYERDYAPLVALELEKYLAPNGNHN